MRHCDQWVRQYRNSTKGRAVHADLLDLARLHPGLTRQLIRQARMHRITGNLQPLPHERDVMFDKGKYVKSRFSDAVVRVSGPGMMEESFAGYVVDGAGIYEVGEYSDRWMKHSFEEKDR